MTLQRALETAAFRLGISYSRAVSYWHHKVRMVSQPMKRTHSDSEREPLAGRRSGSWKRKLRAWKRWTLRLRRAWLAGRDTGAGKG